MEKIKHRKYRNTGLIFEMLTRQITSDILEGDENSEAIDILKEYFDGSSEISKELELYKLLMEETLQGENQAKEFIEEVVKTRENLDLQQLQEEKYDIIGEIKKKYPLKEFFKSRVDNYRELASIYKVFKVNEEDNNYEPSDYVRSKYTIVEHVTNEDVDKEEIENEVKEELEEQSRDLRLLTQRVMIEKFNKKYGSLLDEQKELLRKYINNISNTNNLREYVNEEVRTLKEDLKDLREKIDNQVVDIKVKEATKLIEEIQDDSVVRDDEISNLLMYYQLREDIQNALEKQKQQ